jgi:hypothetical protein
MTDPADAIAERLIEAAYECFGRPPEAGGEYIHTVTRETEVPAYFRTTLLFARGPRSRALWQYFKKLKNKNGDAGMVMDAGLKYPAHQAALPDAERRLIEEINNFHEWYSHSITRSPMSGTSSQCGTTASTRSPSSKKWMISRRTRKKPLQAASSSFFSCSFCRMSARAPHKRLRCEGDAESVLARRLHFVSFLPLKSWMIYCR